MAVALVGQPRSEHRRLGRGRPEKREECAAWLSSYSGLEPHGSGPLLHTTSAPTLARRQETVFLPSAVISSPWERSTSHFRFVMQTLGPINRESGSSWGGRQ